MNEQENLSNIEKKNIMKETKELNKIKNEKKEFENQKKNLFEENLEKKKEKKFLENLENEIYRKKLDEIFEKKEKKILMEKKKEKENEKSIKEKIKQKNKDLNQIKFEEFYYLTQKKKFFQNEIKNENQIKNENIKILKKFINNIFNETNSKEIQYENICKFSNYIKKYLIDEIKNNNNKNFIDIEKIKKNDEFFPLKILSKSLELFDIKTFIENNNNNNLIIFTCLNLIINGKALKIKIEIFYNFGKEKNEEILNNFEERNKFISDVKIFFEREFNVNYEDIIICNFRCSNIEKYFSINVIFIKDNLSTESLNNIEDYKNFKRDIKNLENKNNIIKIHLERLLSFILLNSEIFYSNKNFMKDINIEKNIEYFHNKNFNFNNNNNKNKNNNNKNNKKNKNVKKNENNKNEEIIKNLNLLLLNKFNKIDFFETICHYFAVFNGFLYENNNRINFDDKNQICFIKDINYCCQNYSIEIDGYFCVFMNLVKKINNEIDEYVIVEDNKNNIQPFKLIIIKIDKNE